jgi:hypothetical protein
MRAARRLDMGAVAQPRRAAGLSAFETLAGARRSQRHQPYERNAGKVVAASIAARRMISAGTRGNSYRIR